MSAADVTRLEQIPEERNALLSELRRVQLVVTNLRRRLPATRPKSLADRAQYDELLRTITDLDGEGLPRHMGVSFDDAVSLVGKPGVAALQRRLAELDAAEARLQIHVARWPTPDTTHPYRYTGPADGHLHFDGRAHRYLEVGEVINLTEDQATACRDRFEPVTEEEPATEVVAS